MDAEANFAQRLPGADAMTIGNAGGGPLDSRSPTDKRRADEEASFDYVSMIVERIERERQHETQWLSETHSYAGQTLTGAKWREMTTWFDDAENVSAWEDGMMTETGESRAEVRRTGGKMKRFYDLMDKDAKGTLSGEEQGEFTTIQNDAEVRRGLEVQRDIEALHSRRGYDQTAKSEAAFDGTRDERIPQRARLDEDDAGLGGTLARVAPLSSSYKDAAVGKTAPSPLAPKPSPALAANTVQVTADHMFGYRDGRDVPFADALCYGLC